MGEIKDSINDFQETMRVLSRKNEEKTKKFKDFMDSVMVGDILDKKTKELISLGAAITAKCEYCIGLHTRNALSAGATKDEVLETAMVAVLMGGSPALTHVTKVRKALEEFQSE